MKNSFDFANIYLTGSNGGIVTIRPVDIYYLEEIDGGTIVHLVNGGSQADIFVRQTPGRIKQKVNNLAKRQDKEHELMEEEAKKKAQENFFDKYPKTKAMFQQEVEEMGKAN